MGLSDLVASDKVFFAAPGVTNGELLRGVRYVPQGATTHTVVMRSKTGTVRYIEAHHRLDRLSRIIDAHGVMATDAPPAHGATRRGHLTEGHVTPNSVPSDHDGLPL